MANQIPVGWHYFTSRDPSPKRKNRYTPALADKRHPACPIAPIGPAPAASPGHAGRAARPCSPRCRSLHKPPRILESVVQIEIPPFCVGLQPRRPRPRSAWVSNPAVRVPVRRGSPTPPSASPFGAGLRPRRSTRPKANRQRVCLPYLMVGEVAVRAMKSVCLNARPCPAAPAAQRLTPSILPRGPRRSQQSETPPVSVRPNSRPPDLGEFALLPDWQNHRPPRSSTRVEDSCPGK